MKTNMAAMVSDWPRHFRLLLWNRRTEFNETSKKARTKCSLPSSCFWADRNTKISARSLINWDISDFLSKWNWWHLTRSKNSTSSTRFFCFYFRPIGKPRWLPLPLIGWDFFDLFSATGEQNSTKLDRKQELNVLYQYFFGGGGGA